MVAMWMKKSLKVWAALWGGWTSSMALAPVVDGDIVADAGEAGSSLRSE